MLIMHRVTGTPVLFADVRHYFTDRGMWDLENSGRPPPGSPARGAPAENMAKVHLTRRERACFPYGERLVHHLAAAGEIPLGASQGPTAATACREPSALSRGATTPRPTRRSMRQSTYVWPHAFTRFGRTCRGVPVRALQHQPLAPVRSDVAAELAAACRFLDIDLERLDAPDKPAMGSW